MMMFLRTPLTKRALKGAFAIMIVTSCEMPVFVLPPSFLWMAHMPLGIKVGIPRAALRQRAHGAH